MTPTDDIVETTLLADDLRRLTAVLATAKAIVLNDPLVAIPTPSDVLVLELKDYGAIGDGIADDAAAWSQALAVAKAHQGPKILRVPAGTYRIASTTGTFPNRWHLFLEGIHDLLIDAEPGTTIIATTPATVLRVVYGHNIRIRNLTIDYDPLSFTQGRIIALDRDARTLDWRLDDGWPDLSTFPFNQGKLDGKPRAEDGRPIAHFGFKVGSYELLAPRTYRLHWKADAWNDPARLTEDLQPDRPFALHTRGLADSQSAIYVESSDFIDFENVQIHSAYDHAVHGVDTCAVIFRHCYLGPQPNSNRFTVSNADGFHLRSNRHGPCLYDTKVFRVNDDCTNFYHRAISISAVESDTSFLIDAAGDRSDATKNFKPNSDHYRVGDLVIIINAATFEPRGIARIASTSAALIEGNSITRLTLDSSISGVLSRIQLGEPASLAHGAQLCFSDPNAPVEDFLMNLSNKSDGLVIKRCLFADNTVCAVKMKGSHGLIAENRFERNPSAGIVLWAELNWQEGYLARHLLVRDNTFVGHQSGEGTYIQACAYRPGKKYPKYNAPIVGPVTIKNNTFIDCAPRTVRLERCHNIILEGNNFSATPLPHLELGEFTKNLEVSDVPAESVSRAKD